MSYAYTFDTVTGTAGADHLTGTAGSDVLNGLGGNDLLEGRGRSDTLNGGAGADTLRGGSGNDVLRGGGGNDRFSFEGGLAQGRDRIYGEAGADRFAVGVGAHTVTGGAGRDTYVLVVNPEPGGMVVTDFAAGAGGDRLDLAEFFYTKVPLVEVPLDPFGQADPAGLDVEPDPIVFVDTGEYIRFRQSGGDTLLQIDRDGADGDAYTWQTFLTLRGVEKSALTGANLVGVVIEGTLGDDTLVGALGDDTIVGFGGDDILNGLLGADSMEGGDGGDTYYVDNGGDEVVETGNAAGLDQGPAGLGSIVDTVIASINYSLAGVDFVENVTLTGSATRGTGNELNNLITGNGLANTLAGLSGKDTVLGGGGNDRLEGDGGKDTLTGGTGKDKFEFDTALNASTNVDRITDFRPVDDTIQLDRTIFTKLATGSLASKAFYEGAAAHDSSDRIVYNENTGNLYYDADGSNDASSAILFATLAGTPTLTAADFFVVA